MRDDSAEILFQVFVVVVVVFAGGRREQFRHGQGRPLFHKVHRECPLRLPAGKFWRGCRLPHRHHGTVSLSGHALEKLFI